MTFQIRKATPEEQAAIDAILDPKKQQPVQEQPAPEQPAPQGN